ncbi:peptidase [Streptomyces sp. NPDC002573]|uniref:COG1470 family protein n=1 Tax=Streptomyces sp. NPDC002573 TaxID=3364651 RepID=UPI0036C597FA
MHKYIPAGALCLLALVGTISAPPSATASPRIAAEGTGGHDSFSVRLVDIPASLVDDTRARYYVIDDLRPGTTIRRRVEVANTSSRPARVVMYPGAAEIRKGSFIGAPGGRRSELTSWTSLSSKRLVLPAHSKARTTVTIHVPGDAAPGERYGVIWAQMSSGNGPGVTLVNRAGIRVYLSVEGHNPPPTKFSVSTMTGERDQAGRAIVRAQVHNTGGRALDLNGTLNLTKVKGSVSAGPYAIQLGTTLAPGESEPVTVPVTDQMANGPWNARLHLESGMYDETYSARVTFPAHTGYGHPARAHADASSSHSVLYGEVAGAVLATAAFPFAVMSWRRRRRQQGQGEPGATR